jgi:hypothetical protein
MLSALRVSTLTNSNMIQLWRYLILTIPNVYNAIYKSYETTIFSLDVVLKLNGNFKAAKLFCLFYNGTF